MKKTLITVGFLIGTLFSFCQVGSKEYNELIRKSRLLYMAKDYQNAAITVSAAIRMGGDSTPIDDIDRAAYSWSLAGNADSSFFYLNMIAETNGLTFDEVNDILLDEDFTSLKNDSRWQVVKDKMFLTAYTTYIIALEDAVGVKVIPAKNKLEFARGLGDHNDSFYLHLNDQAYEFLRKKNFDKAFRYIKVGIGHFPWAWSVCRNMGDYYNAIGDKTRAFVYNARALNVKYKYIPFEGKSLEKIDSAIIKDYKDLSIQSDRTFLPPDYLVNTLANAAIRQGLNDEAHELLKMNIVNYPGNFSGYRAMGDYYNKKGNKEKADEYNTRSWLLQYKLPDNFFDSSFNVSEYFIIRTENSSKQAGHSLLPPEPMINNLGNQFLNKKMYDKAELLFKMNVQNYPQSRNAYSRISAFYKVIGDKSKEEEFNKLGQSIKANSANQGFSGNEPIADTSYNVDVAKPVCKINCLSILFDEAHKNYHTSVGRYKPFADLITNDGFNVIRGRTVFTKALLQKVNVVVIASTLSIQSKEIKILDEWIREGGSLLAITDHDNSSSNELLQSLGVQTPDINYTTDSLHGGFGIIFSKVDKSLGNHPIINGRDSSEKIRVVKTFTGRTIIGPAASSVLLPLSESAVDYMTIEPNMRSLEYMIPISVNGPRSHGVAFSFGRGKVVVVSEAAMLTAQLFPPDGRQVGMNVPDSDNRQFALNIIHWLTGYLK